MNEAPALLDSMDAPAGISPAARLPDAQWEIIRFCVQCVKFLGVPRSIGEIFGFVFTSPQPVTFEEIVSSLGISNGSASHGLRYLRRIGALGITYVARDRRDHYQAETSFRRLCSGYMMENVTLHLSDQSERLSAMRERFAGETDARCEHLPEKLETLLSWLSQAGAAVAAAAQTIKSPQPGENAAP